MDFGFCFCVVQILSVAIFRATNSGCYEPNPVERDLGGCRLSPLPDRNGRKLVDDRGETTHVSFRAGRMLLVNGCKTPYTSAEIPPAGAPAGFDSAAIGGFRVLRYAVVPLRSE